MMYEKRPVKRMVVKSGSGWMFDKTENGYVLNRDQLDATIEEIALISNEREIMWVSSGAIATALWKLGLKEVSDDVHKKAQLAGIGQHSLMHLYEDEFGRYGKVCAQCLLGRENVIEDVDEKDIKEDDPRLNVKINLEGYLKDGVIPILNENDFVYIAEIENYRTPRDRIFGDNDKLAALIAKYTDSDLVVMLSYPIEDLGRGGGEAKEEARHILEEAGIPLVIINDRYEKVDGRYKPKIREFLGCTRRTKKIL